MLKDPHETALIDDVAAALGQVTDIGRAALGNCCRIIRNELLFFAAIRGWQVVRYDEFAEWAVARTDGADVWVILDPLFPVDRLNTGVFRARCSRAFINGQIVVRESDISRWESVDADKFIGLIDDGVLTGDTLRYVVGRICKAPGPSVDLISEVVVCTSTSDGRMAVEGAAPEAGWRQYVPANSVAVHLRDALPVLPFSGRSIESHGLVAALAEPTPIRYPATAFAGGAWGALSRDRSFGAATREARSSFVQEFSALLNRPALVSDLALISPHSAIWSARREAIRPEDKLSDVIL